MSVNQKKVQQGRSNPRREKAHEEQKGQRRVTRPTPSEDRGQKRVNRPPKSGNKGK